MTSKAYQIADAIQTLFEAPALTGIGSGSVVDDPDYAFELADLPMVAVYLGDEVPADRVLLGSHDHTLTLTVRVTAKKGGVAGKSALLSCDPMMVATHNRLMADLTLGGIVLDIRKGGTRRQRDVIDVPVAYTEIEYQVDYRTTATSLEG